MKLLFIADPLQSFKIYKDTTFAMMREAQRRGHTLTVCEPQHITWQRGSKVTARVQDIRLTGDATHWYEAQPQRSAALADFDAVLMRKDPPFDSEYFYATHLLEQAERDGARVFNKPSALRDHPEKLAIMEFPQFIGPTLVTRDAEDIRRFHAEHQDIILKPLDGMGGMGIFRVGPDGLNLGSITETLNRHGAQSVMVQKFLPRSSTATSGFSSLVASRCRSAWRAFPKAAKCGAIWPLAARAWRALCLPGIGRLVKHWGRCCNPAVCCWLAWM